jgi:ABC-type sugar transport system substrate-binding protein
MKKILLATVVFAISIGNVYADTFVLSMKGPAAGNPYWAAVEKGAKAKGKELGVDVIVVAPPSDSAIQAQVEQIEDLIAQKVNGIALAPTDDNALAPVAKAAKAAGIPVVLVDKYVDEDNLYAGIPMIGADNDAAARLAGEYFCKYLKKGDEVAVLQGSMSYSNGRQRASGIRKGFEGCGLKIVSEQPADWDRAKAMAVIEAVLAGNPKLKGVFGSNDNMALGAVEALKAAAKLKDVMVVGFDGNPDAVTSILAGEMKGSQAQRPEQLGGLAIQALVNLKAGKAIPPKTDTGTFLITKENAQQFK